jgi:hypothetical protein
MAKTVSLMGLPRVVCLMHVVSGACGDARKVEPLASVVEEGGLQRECGRARSNSSNL